MGNYRFKLSDIIPNSWLYKLRDMAKSSTNPDANSTRKNPKQLVQEGNKAQKLHQQSIPRKSYHFTRDLGLNGSVSHSKQRLLSIGYSPVVNSPRWSTNKRRTNTRKCKPPRLVSSSVSSGCSCKATLDSVCAETEQVSLPDPEYSGSESDNSSSVEQPLQLSQTFDQMVSSSSSSSSGIKSGSSDITFDIPKGSLDPEIDLPPISTKPLKFRDMAKNVKLQRVDTEAGIFYSPLVKEHVPASPSPKPSPFIRGFTMNSSGVKLRINSNSPRISLRQKKPQQGGQRKSSVTASLPSMSGNQSTRRSVSDSIAVVMSSEDPQRDFRESMMEMIKENNIRASKDLEELLACYLTLNSDEYHHLIITVFKQIWFDLINIRLK